MSTEKKHTPTQGGWFFDEEAEPAIDKISGMPYLSIYGGGFEIARVHGNGRTNSRADARLMASSKQMLEALEDCDKAMTSLTDRQLIDNPAIMQAIVDVRAAIRAAKGGQ